MTRAVITMQLRQAVVSAVLTGVPQKSIRRKFQLSKHQMRRILQEANICTPAERVNPLPPLESITRIDSGNAMVPAIRITYEHAVKHNPEGATQALSEHRSMKSQTQDAAPESLEWYYWWQDSVVDFEEIILDLDTFIALQKQHAYPCFVACTSVGLRLRSSKQLPTVPELVKDNVQQVSEQWWRDPKTIEKVKNAAGKWVKGFEAFGVL